MARSSNGGANNTVPTGLSGVVAIAAGGGHSLALKDDGTVVGWGNAGSVPTGLTGVMAVAAAEYYSLALKNDGTVVGWGDMASGAVPAGLANVAKITSGGFYSLALKSDGVFVGWGENLFGQATPPADLFNIVSISAGFDFGLALRDVAADAAAAITVQPVSQTVTVGNSVTFTAAASGAPVPTYQWKKGGADINGATGTSYTITSIGTDDAGSYTFVATNYLGSTTSTAATLTVNPLPVVSNLGSARNVLVPGQALSLGVTATGTGTLSYQWYHRGRPIPGATGTQFDVANSTYADDGAYWVVVSDNYGVVGSKPTFVMVAPLTTKVVAWGQNNQDQTNVPAGLNDIIGISTSPAGYTLGLKRDGTVVSWGTTPDSGQAEVPSDLTNVVAVSAGDSVAAALKSNGTVVTWGEHGTAATNVPANLSNVVSIAAGQHHIVALKTDGTVAGWGSYNGGNVPLGLSGVIAITANTDFSVAIKSDGSIVSWGFNVNSYPPGNLTSVASISIGDFYGMAAKSDGTVVVWGFDRDGQTVVPVGLSGVVAVANGTSHMLALKSDGSVVVWGYDTVGEAALPSGLTNAFAIAAAAHWSYALRDSYPAPGITTQPEGQTVNVGGSVTLSGGANGAPTLTYQWQKNGVDISGATGSSYTIAMAAPNDAGSYTLVVTNAAGTATSSTAILIVHVLASDFNSDGQSDILWQNKATGQRALWLMNGVMGGFTPTSIVDLGYVDAAWVMAGTGDFNGDGQSDILWQNTVTGQRALWLMNGIMAGFTPASIVNLGYVGTDWVIAGTGDFNSDGQADILWQNTATGQRALWLMNGIMGGFTPASIVNLGYVDTNWVMAGTGDFNSDGQTDILWQNTATGQRALWLMNGIGSGFTPVSIVDLGYVDTNWLIAK